MDAEWLEFKLRMEDLMKEARQVVGLDAPDMNPLNADCGEYSNKFEMMNTLGESLICCLLDALEVSGLQRGTLESIEEGEKMYLVLESEESCEFEKKIEKKTARGEPGTSGSVPGIISFITRTYDVHDLWVFNFKYSHSCHLSRKKKSPSASSSSSKTLVWSGSGHKSIHWPRERGPRPKKTVNNPIEVDITWLARHVKGRSLFRINTEAAACPTLNEEVNTLSKRAELIKEWCQSVSDYIVGISELSETDDDQIDHDDDERTDSLKLSLSPLVVSEADAVVIREDHRNSLLIKIAELSKCYKTALYKNATLITFQERFVHLACGDVISSVKSFESSIDFMDRMTMRILTESLQTKFSSDEFGVAFQYFKKRLFARKYRPVPFLDQIRTGRNHPEGFLRITDDAGKLMEVDRRLVSLSSSVSPEILIPITASARVTLPVKEGNVSVNCFVNQKVSGEAESQTFNIGLRAEQLSSFIVVLGKMAGAGMMIPSHAAILRNRDDLTIPLVLSEIPSAKEFKDAIESLSPEQKRFAEAYRSMQLDGTLFSIAIIQIKPQMEVVLNLPEGSLAKEVELSEKLLKMMTTDGLSSDLLSASKSCSDPLLDVRRNIDRIDGLLQQERDEILREQERLRRIEEEKKRQEQKRLEAERRWKEMERRQRVDGANLENILCASRELQSTARTFKRAARKSKGFGFGMPTISMPSISGLSSSMSSRAMKKCESIRVEDCMEAMTEEGAAFYQEGECVSKSAECTLDGIVSGLNDEQEKCQQNVEMEGDVDKVQDNNKDQDTREDEEGGESKPTAIESAATDKWDFSKIPSILEQKFSSTTETAAALRPVTLKTGDCWSKLAFSSILDSRGEVASLSGLSLKSEKEAAFNLLDALTKSGTVAVKEVSVSILFGFSHSWAESILKTVAKRNRNPLEIAANTALELARTLHDVHDIAGCD
eukprot:TRINITY_DN1069_c1_g1_i6.p1 TRINITY_DN1069_c1_g1~~TRINITY_DN1069_c1_g1_i6.p1  ORF type:complete len:944 (+),score=222.58 TRINITY_DN1069_c1_g1_i6:428-3259(+)